MLRGSSVVDDSKAVRLNEITKGMSIKRRSMKYTLGSSEARGQEKGKTSQGGPGGLASTEERRRTQKKPSEDSVSTRKCWSLLLAGQR